MGWEFRTLWTLVYLRVSITALGGRREHKIQELGDRSGAQEHLRYTFETLTRSVSNKISIQCVIHQLHHETSKIFKQHL